MSPRMPQTMNPVTPPTICTSLTRSRKLRIGDSAKTKEWSLEDHRKYLLDRYLAVITSTKTHTTLSSRECPEVNVCALATLYSH